MIIFRYWIKMNSIRENTQHYSYTTTGYQFKYFWSIVKVNTNVLWVNLHIKRYTKVIWIQRFCGRHRFLSWKGSSGVLTVPAWSKSASWRRHIWWLCVVIYDFRKNGIGEYSVICFGSTRRLGENGAIPWESNQIRPFIISRRFTNQNNIQRWLPSAENQELRWIQVRFKEIYNLYHMFAQKEAKLSIQW